MSFGFRHLSLALFMLLPQLAFSEPLAVDGNDQAQAFSFKYGGICYAIFPDHITPRSGFDVVTTAPIRTGTVDIFDFMRFQNLDLALGQVYGAASEPCEPALRSTRFDDGGSFASETVASLATIATSGRVERVPVRIDIVDYTHIEISAIREEDQGRIGQGRSGSMVVIDERPVGMLIDVSPESHDGRADIRALRFDAAIAWLGRFLDRSVSSPTGGRTEVAADELPFEVTAWSANPMSGTADPRSIASDSVGPYVVAPGDLPFTIEISLAEAAIERGVAGVVIESQHKDATTTVPRSSRIAVRRSDGGAFRSLTSGIGASNGRTDIPIRSQRFRALRIEILDGWDASLPLRLDRIRILANN